MSLAIEQPLLFDPSQYPTGTELLLPPDEQHRFTGEKLAKNNEAKYLAIVRALGQGMGRRQIARAFGVSHHTVQAIWEREPSLVATEKEKTGRQLRRVTRMSLDALEEALDEGRITYGQLPVTTAILLDKSMAWDGQATTVVNVRHEIDQQKVRALFESLQAPIVTVQAPALDAEMVSPESASGDIARIWPENEENGGHVTADVTASGEPNVTNTLTTAPTGFDLAPPVTVTGTTPSAPPESASAPHEFSVGRGGGGSKIFKAGAVPMGSPSEILT